jgi:hypothetical protein
MKHEQNLNLREELSGFYQDANVSRASKDRVVCKVLILQ